MTTETHSATVDLLHHAYAVDEQLPRPLNLKTTIGEIEATIEALEMVGVE